PQFADSLRVQREKRLWIKVPYEKFREFLEFAADTLRVNIFCMLTGLDDKENFSFIYHMSDDKGLMLNIETFVPKTAARIATVTDMYPAADLQEREVLDLFGVQIDGLPEGKRYPLPDNWPDGEYPLRKDWKAEERLDAKEPFKKKQ
ncbi:MAG: NADH-quinone oxidoreductase subunit C, partial [Endomicrobia bacterium]|nr:NADH-quinone oxidoreductase subunit C [Endomicrobiia bacterium]